MKTRLLLIVPIIVGLAISLPFVINFTSGGTIHYTQNIDPRFSEVTANGFTISSDIDISSIRVEDEIQGISITTIQNTGGFIHMDDPLPILQKLFPDKEIISFAVMSNDVEIPHTSEDGKLGISVNNTHMILIVGSQKYEPGFKDEKFSLIKIFKGDIASAKAIKFIGWTNQPNQEILLTVTAPNGDIISTGKLSPMNNGTFADAITTGGPLWKQQDGIYLVTVQQGDDSTNSAYFELNLKDGNIITGK